MAWTILQGMSSYLPSLPDFTKGLVIGVAVVMVSSWLTRRMSSNN